MVRNPISKLQEIKPARRSIGKRLRRLERSTLRHAHKFIVQRASNLRAGQRYVIGWLLLTALLSGIAFWQTGISSSQYRAEVPEEGGVYTEGAFGPMDNLNPIFAASSAERSGSRLLFANLLTYDDKGDLVGELAERWTVAANGRTYFVKLRDNAKWHDGQPITADDVVFTFGLIKNADTRSPLYASWRNIAVEKVSDKTVKFILPAQYAAFANSLTVGILPEHVLKDVKPSELRTESYNRAPTVASGPFRFTGLRAADPSQQHYILSMEANPNYMLGRPKLNGFQLHAYKDREALARALRTQEVASVSDLTYNQLANMNLDPFEEVNAPLYNGVYAFLRVDNPILRDPKVRKALQLATDYPALIKLFGGTAQTLNGPLLPTQLGYRNDTKQPRMDLAKANKLLDKAGWRMAGEGSRRIKNGNALKLQLATVSSGNYPALAEALMNQWRKIGVEFEPNLVRADDIQQNVIFPRAYDVLIYEVVIGRDSDVFAYWHSSQAAEHGYNLSNYKSARVDDALNSARTHLNPKVRANKYHTFARQWLIDVPAIGLYRPSLVYVQNRFVETFNLRPLVDPTDRYFNVRYWAAGHELLYPTR